VDSGYTENVGYGFKSTVAEYGTDEEVWTALREEPNTAVISAQLAPTRENFDFGDGPPSIELSGFYGDDATLPDDLYIQAETPNRAGRGTCASWACWRTRRSSRRA
jgi:hypothetical protein